MICLFDGKNCNCVNPVTDKTVFREIIESRIRNLELNIKYDSYPYVATETKNPRIEIEKLKAKLENET